MIVEGFGDIDVENIRCECGQYKVCGCKSQDEQVKDILASLELVIHDAKLARSEDRNNIDRVLSITITDLEKIHSFLYYNVYNNQQ